jgi:hypothetical protein
MRYNSFTGITSTILIALMLTTTITIGPLNLLQINNASAQQSSNPTSTSPPPSNPSSQEPNTMQMKSMMSNPSSTITSAPANFTGSISIFSPIINGFKSSIHVGLSNAISIAEKSLGNNSTTLAAFIHPDKGFVVYNIFALDSNNNVHKVIVDPGNGKILSSQQMSIMEMMMMLHGGMGSKNMMMGPSMDNGMMMNHGMGMGPGMDNGMMMNHGMGMDKPWP